MGSSMNGQKEGIKLGLKMKSISECMAVKLVLKQIPHLLLHSTVSRYVTQVVERLLTTSSPTLCRIVEATFYSLAVITFALFVIIEGCVVVQSYQYMIKESNCALMLPSDLEINEHQTFPNHRQYNPEKIIFYL